MLVKRTNLKVFTSKFVGTGASSYKKRIYRAAVSQRLRNTGLEGWGRSNSSATLSTKRLVREPRNSHKSRN